MAGSMGLTGFVKCCCLQFLAFFSIDNDFLQWIINYIAKVYPLSCVEDASMGGVNGSRLVATRQLPVSGSKISTSYMKSTIFAFGLSAKLMPKALELLFAAFLH
jgi:hypothetical protein